MCSLPMLRHALQDFSLLVQPSSSLRPQHDHKCEALDFSTGCFSLVDFYWEMNVMMNVVVNVVVNVGGGGSRKAAWHKENG